MNDANKLQRKTTINFFFFLTYIIYIFFTYITSTLIYAIKMVYIL